MSVRWTQSLFVNGIARNRIYGRGPGVTVRPNLRSAPKPELRISSFSVGGALVLGLYTGYFILNNFSYPSINLLRGLDDDAPSLVPYSEVQKHNTRASCWVIVEGRIYDVTSIIDTHPGGVAAILKHAGKDSTNVFLPIHSSATLSALPPEAYIGLVDPSTVPRQPLHLGAEELRIKDARALLPPPAAAISLRDIEELAKTVLSPTAWAYYRSAGDDESTYRENFAAFSRFWFRPRVLNKVSRIETTASMLSIPSSLPIFIAPAALARLGHPEGEKNLVRAAGKEGILQGISINASCSIDEVMSVKLPDQSLFFQLYMDKDRSKSEALIKRVEQVGFKAIMLTVDAAVPGKRELDQRTKSDFSGSAHGLSSTGGLGVANSISGYQDPDVCWDDIAWIRSLTKLPLIIKGIQCIEDAEKAFQHDIQGIVISNHGGRELDYSPAPMTVLHELHMRRPDLLKKYDVYIDGGVRRGTDVLKALCLGAKAVGLGRPFLYANGVWGEEGCQRVIQIMREEIETGMRLLGVTSIAQLTPELVRFVDRYHP